MPATHYCQGDALLSMQAGTFPTDEDGRPLPGYKAYLQPRALAEALMEAEAERLMALEQAQQNNTTDD